MSSHRNQLEITVSKEVSERLEALAPAGVSVGEFIGNLVTKSVQFIDINEAASLLCIAPSTLRQKASRGEVPYYKPSKNLLFDREELLEVIRSSRRGTTVEFRKAAAEHMARNMK